MNSPTKTGYSRRMLFDDNGEVFGGAFTLPCSSPKVDTGLLSGIMPTPDSLETDMLNNDL
jgi:hypothetical protein